MSARVFVKSRKGSARRGAGGIAAQNKASRAAKSFMRVNTQAVVKQALASELRKQAGFVDLALASYGMDTTGSVTLIATIPQGAAQTQRIGKKAAYKSLQIRGRVAAGTAGSINIGGWMVVYDKEPQGSLPAVTDILNTISSNSFNNDVNSDRWQILRREVVQFIGNTTTPAVGLEQFVVEEFVDLRSLPIQFSNAGDGAIADIKKGALYFVTFGNTANGTSSPFASVGFRTRFMDILG